MLSNRGLFAARRKHSRSSKKLGRQYGALTVSTGDVVLDELLSYLAEPDKRLSIIYGLLKNKKGRQQLTSALHCIPGRIQDAMRGAQEHYSILQKDIEHPGLSNEIVSEHKGWVAGYGVEINLLGKVADEIASAISQYYYGKPMHMKP